ncbi:MAG TPA: hypothetical protein VGM91_17620 [Conexibacter sp.]|jgi:fatty acid desaturase
MSGLRPVEGHPRIAATRRGVAHAFWALAAGVIVAYVFFLGLGAFGTNEVVWLTIGVIVLSVLWVIHALLNARAQHAGPHDQELHHEQERRGF